MNLRNSICSREGSTMIIPKHPKDSLYIFGGRAGEYFSIHFVLNLKTKMWRKIIIKGDDSALTGIFG